VRTAIRPSASLAKRSMVAPERNRGKEGRTLAVARIRARHIALALVLVLIAPTAASAGSVWDPDDPPYGLDIRWVGAYVQRDGTMRVTMAFHTPVRLTWFNRGFFHEWRRVRVGFTDRQFPPFFFVLFFRNSGGGLSAEFCESGSSCSGHVPVSRPNRFTIRTIVPLFDRYGPGADGGTWRFRGTTTQAKGKPPSGRHPVIDQTGWGILT
jgi:hypothetical protein